MWLAVGLVWGTSWGVIGLGLRDLPPLTFAASRTMIAAAALVLYALARHGGRLPRTRRAVSFWLAMGVPQIGAPYALIFWAQQHIDSGLTAMLFATFPVFTTVLAHFVLHDEPLTVRRVSGVMLAVVAVAVLIGQPSGFVAPPLLPVLAVLLASFSGAVGTVLVRRHGRETSTVWLTALQVTAAGGFLAILALVFERGASVRVTPDSVLAVVYLALVVTVGCYIGLFWLLKHLEAAVVSMGVVLETTVAVFVGAVILGEMLTWLNVLGLTLVALSIWFVTKRPPARELIRP